SSPSGPIREAQLLAAEAFGADQTWFLVNGCSVGIHAAVMAVTTAAAAAMTSSSSGSGGGSGGDGGVGRGGAGGGTGTLLVARNCHLSAFSAMVLSGCEPYWLLPEVDPRVGVAHCVTPGSVQAALEDAAAQGRRVVGVLVVSPTYYGAVADVEGISRVCHFYDVPLLVDEAHGGHFAFLRDPPTPAPAAGSLSEQEQHVEHPTQSQHLSQQQQEVGQQQHQPLSSACISSPTTSLTSPTTTAPRLSLPRSALACGADVVIQSTHKVLGA
ncbi:hypothetical protein Agub_g5129, partial [Astrephomene gubernaculifera]